MENQGDKLTDVLPHYIKEESIGFSSHAGSDSDVVADLIQKYCSSDKIPEIKKSLKNVVIFEKHKSKSEKNTAPRLKKTHLSLNEKRKLGLYKLSRKGLNYDKFLELNNLWIQYMLDSLDFHHFEKKNELDTVEWDAKPPPVVCSNQCQRESQSEAKFHQRQEHQSQNRTRESSSYQKEAQPDCQGPVAFRSPSTHRRISTSYQRSRVRRDSASTTQATTFAAEEPGVRRYESDVHLKTKGKVDVGDKQWEQLSAQLYKADYHGAELTVVRAKCPSLVGTRGIVVMDTKNTFRLIGKDNIIRTIPKESCVFQIHLNAFRLTLYGGQLCVKPAERSTKKIRSNLSMDL